jgi:hypothetical protein
MERIFEEATSTGRRREFLYDPQGQSMHLLRVCRLSRGAPFKLRLGGDFLPMAAPSL